MSGKIFIIEGLDGSGKATQAEMLYKKLLADGQNVRKIAFPNYESDSSALVKMYLNGEFGSNPDDVNPYAASTFFAVDRYASFKSDWEKFYNDGGIIISDRYTTSNGAHQCSKLKSDKWDNFLNWLFDFEYNKMGLPEPTAVVYLEMSTSVSQKLMSERYHGEESKKDIHEKNITYLNQCRLAANYCADTFNWERISCDNGENPYTIEEISKKVFDYVKKSI